MEFDLAPGSVASITGFRSFDLGLPAGGTMYALAAYTFSEIAARFGRFMLAATPHFLNSHAFFSINFCNQTCA